VRHHRGFIRLRTTLAAFCLAWTGAPQAHAEEAVRLEEWSQGPIRYILTAEEEREFRRLGTDNERVAFIERFWARRDPSPRTYENEYRQLFWARVREANEKFRDSAGPGWRTDRGKIYILHGPPDEVQSDETVRIDSTSGSGEGIVRWLYVGRPGGRKDLDPVVAVPFVRSSTGEFKLSYDPLLTSVFLDWNYLRDLSRNSGWAHWVASNVPTNGSRMTAMLDLGRLQEIPRAEEILLAQVDTYEIFQSAPLPVQVHRFEAPGESDALVVLTYFLPPAAGESETALVARLTPEDPGGAPLIASEAAFRVEATRAGRVAQTRFRVKPGTWDLLALAVDPDSDTSAAYRGTVEIAPRGDGLRLSDPIFAGRLSPLPYATMATYDAPFTFGAFRAVPRETFAVPRGEPIQILLEAYGGAPPYRALFRLEGEEDDGRFTALGDPTPAEEPLGAFAWSLPTSPAWPLGSYRVRIRVEDDRGARVEREVRFRVTDGP
jgi:GWxTD domain-containing protein